MEIDEATRMGERNKEVIELFRNWCGHVGVVLVGGVGLVEQMSGLPIGMRSFTCPHARGRGIGGMQLEDVAVDYFRRNCIDCKARSPGRLPNISEVVYARDAEHDRREAERTRAAAASALEVKARIDAREALRVDGDHARNSVVDLLNAFDRDPSDANLDALLESSRAVPEVFRGGIENAVFALAAGQGVRATGALKLLDGVTQDRKRLSAAALNALAQGSVDHLAGEIVARGIDSGHEALVAEAVPSLIYIARPPFRRYPGFQEPEVTPGPLVAAFRASPSAVIIGLRRWLRDPEKERRRSAALALRELMKAIEPAVALALVGDLIASFVQKDDGYDGGEAATTVARVLSAAFVAYPSEVDKELREAFITGDPRIAVGVARTYAHLFRPGRWNERAVRASTATTAQRLAFDWIVSTISTLPRDHNVADEIVGVLRDSDTVPWDVVAGATPTLLGLVALAHQESAAPPEEVVATGAEQRFVRQLERQNRVIHLQNVAQAGLAMVREVVEKHPDPVIRLETLKMITSTLEHLPDTPDTLRADLTGALGSFATRPDHAVLILPLVYRGMTDPSTRVRGAAVAAYADLVERVGPEGVPALLHELAVSMLRDPYVIVHARAVDAVSDVRLPEGLCPEATRLVLGVILAHVGGDRPEIASKALGLWLHLLERLGGPTAEDKAVALGLVSKLEINEAARFLTRYGSTLRDGRGYAERLVAVLADVKRWDSSTEPLVDAAEELTKHEVEQNTDRLTALAMRFAKRGDPDRLMQVDLASACFHLLAKHQLWEAASKIAHARVDAVPNTTANKPWRLRLEVIQTAVDLELAASNRQAESVVEKASRLRELESLILTDEKENADARGLFPTARRSPKGD